MRGASRWRLNTCCITTSNLHSRYKDKETFSETFSVLDVKIKRIDKVTPFFKTKQKYGLTVFLAASLSPPIDEASATLDMEFRWASEGERLLARAGTVSVV